MSGMADKRASLTTEERRFADAVRSRLASAPEPKEDIARRAGLGRQTLYALKDAPAGVALRNVVSVARELGIDLVRDVLAAVSEPSAAEPPADLVTGVPLAAAGVGAGAGQLEEREIPRWESEENAARSRRARLRIVTTSPSTSPPGPR